jgi:hypothetical protein
MATTQKVRPVHEVLLGRIKAAIWANQTENGVRHNVTVMRIYKDGNEWKTTDSFGRDDLPLVAKVADLAHTWMDRNPIQSNKPYTMLGAGKLTSAMWKEGGPDSGFRYRFNIYRMDKKTGQVEQIFQPADVESLVKLARVLGMLLAEMARPGLVES